MRAIWKYKLCIGENALNLPLGSIIRYVGAHGGDICMWVEVDINRSQMEEVTLNVVGTGWAEIKPSDKYIGTAQVSVFVWHVYEREQDE